MLHLLTELPPSGLPILQLPTMAVTPASIDACLFLVHPRPRPPARLQWGTVLDELFAQVVPFLPGGPRPARDFPASEDARTCIQMLTAAVLQMIQVGAGGWVLVGWVGGC